MFNFAVKFTVFIMLSVFISQTSMISSSYANPEVKSFSHTGIVHSDKTISSLSNNIDNSNVTEKDCCETECIDARCICYENACSSVVYLMGMNLYEARPLIGVFAFNHLIDRVNRVQSLLYRPPIYT